MAGAALAALCCLGLLTAADGDPAHADEPLRQAVRGASAAAGALTPMPAAGLAVAAEVPTTTTMATPPPPTTVPTTTTRRPAPTTTTTTPPRPQPTKPKPTPTTPLTTVTIPTVPTTPSYPWRHCHWDC
jgi:hypothetical protein